MSLKAVHPLGPTSKPEVAATTQNRGCLIPRQGKTKHAKRGLISLQICAALAILAGALKEKASGQTVLPAYAISDSAADTIVDIAATVGASYLIVAAPQKEHAG